MTKINLPKEEILDMYKMGMMVSVIARHYYVSQNAILVRLRDWGVPLENTVTRQEKLLREIYSTR